MESTSTTVNKFLDNGFVENRFSRRIRNVDWDKDSELTVISSDSCAISEKQVNKMITHNVDSEDQVNTQITASML